MRVPTGAPVPFWLAVKNKFPILTKYSRPTVGTIAVLGTVILTGIIVYSVTFYPKLHNDYYKKVQAEERALLRASKEELARNQRVWSDPFGKH
uniref:Small integral membrane protein 8 n=1 Tax=Heterorhabditis bacteriophora TaxID=37862 RepID=A0A1I7WXZ3_HETBA